MQSATAHSTAVDCLVAGLTSAAFTASLLVLKTTCLLSLLCIDVLAMWSLHATLVSPGNDVAVSLHHMHQLPITCALCGVVVLGVQPQNPKHEDMYVPYVLSTCAQLHQPAGIIMADTSPLFHTPAPRASPARTIPLIHMTVQRAMPSGYALRHVTTQTSSSLFPVQSASRRASQTATNTHHSHVAGQPQPQRAVSRCSPVAVDERGSVS